MQDSHVRGKDLGIRFDEAREGIWVTGVADGSPAQRIGLEPGDVIVGVYGHPVHHADAWDWLMSHEVEYLQLRIRDSRTKCLATRWVSLRGSARFPD